MGADQQFCLRWNNFHTNITSAFESLRDDEDFVDITLACEGRQIKAHKMVLSACSPYFRSLLKGNPCQHPIVFLKDVTFANLTSILDFMYHGEVNVSHNELATFLKTAEALKVRGLAEDEKKRDSENYNESSSPPPPRDPPDPGSPRPEEGSSAPDTQLSDSPPPKRQRRRSGASVHSAEDTNETVLSEARDSSVKNEPQDFNEEEDMLSQSVEHENIKTDVGEDSEERNFGPSESVTISRSQAAMQQLQESFGSFLPGMGQSPGFLPHGATDMPRPPPYPLEGVQGLPPGISALPGPSMSQGAASQDASQGGQLSSTPPSSVSSSFVPPFTSPPPPPLPPPPACSSAASSVVIGAGGGGALTTTGASGGGREVVVASVGGSSGGAGGRGASGVSGASWVGAQCPICFKVLRDKYKLRTHLADIHSAVQHVFTCPVCNRVYKTKNTLTNHISLSHRGYKKRRQHHYHQPHMQPPPPPPPSQLGQQQQEQQSHQQIQQQQLALIDQQGSHQPH
ncbi:broad-complex core protein isoforms 1/2/3/4/5-like isoform X4 [Penaeus chinensis]|uniref:broad-complex core protein isoforms 1/2/3/4/5-like isoform X4 n=1 Tax=Penaeus chinensis TaxID=139456 RepID=UPI001FB67CFB|nr:broad-complex core protein isoforms 1/2/3/4/5-like isoform X4 [Penaeus chinensis]